MPTNLEVDAKMAELEKANETHEKRVDELIEKIEKILAEKKTIAQELKENKDTNFMSTWAIEKRKKFKALGEELKSAQKEVDMICEDANKKAEKLRELGAEIKEMMVEETVAEEKKNNAAEFDSNLPSGSGGSARVGSKDAPE